MESQNPATIQGTSWLRKGLSSPAVVIFLCLFVSFLALKGGPSIPTGDSLAYLNCSQSLIKTNEYGFPYFQLEADGQRTLDYTEPNTVWPPLASA